MEALQLVAVFLGSVIGGIIGSTRSLHKVAAEAALLAVRQHESACQLRAVAAQHLASERPGISDRWNIPAGID